MPKPNTDYVSGSFLDIAKVMVVYCRYCTSKASHALVRESGEPCTESQNPGPAMEIYAFLCPDHFQEWQHMDELKQVEQRSGRVIRQ